MDIIFKTSAVLLSYYYVWLSLTTVGEDKATRRLAKVHDHLVDKISYPIFVIDFAFFMLLEMAREQIIALL